MPTDKRAHRTYATKEKSGQETSIGYDVKTAFGGCMTLMMVLGLMGYLLVRIQTIYGTREHDYRKRDLTYTKAEMLDMNVTLGRFNDSFNFYFGLSFLPPEVDVMNNPYVEFVGYNTTFVDGAWQYDHKHEI